MRKTCIKLIVIALIASYLWQPSCIAAVNTLRPQATAEKNQGASTGFWGRLRQLLGRDASAPKSQRAINFPTGLKDYEKPLANIKAKLAQNRRAADALFGKAQKSIVELGGSNHILVTANRTEGTDIVEQTHSLLSDIEKVLYLSGARASDIVKLDIFMRDISQREICENIISMRYKGRLPVLNFVQQAPANGDLLAIQVLAQTGRGMRVVQVDKNITLVENQGVKWAHVGGIEPDEGLTDPHEQTLNVLEKMKALLEARGFKFENILRTWIYMREIVKKENGIERYAEMNLGRREFFYTAGDDGKFIQFGNGFVIIDPTGKPLEIKTLIPPASTGIGMAGDGLDLVMSCVALQPIEGAKVQFLENPQQISAYAYPDDVLGQTKEGEQASPLFSRGLAAILGDYKVIFVSGTASIKDKLSVHQGDIKKQTDTTIENIGLVLGQAGATLKNIFQLTAYIKHQEDYETVREMVEAQFPGVPCAYLIADVCRPELLVEIEAVAYIEGPSEHKAASDAILGSV